MFQFPLDNLSVTSRFIIYNPNGKSSMHYGMDFGCAKGTPVFAANGGTVVLSTYDSAGGNMIAILDAAAGEMSRYAHLNSRGVKVGDAVARGSLIGYSGNTGSATTGAHLHFETWIVPKGYSYKYSDRTRYAVDPMSVCHLLDGQTFNNNGLTTCTPIPYPEPKPTALSLVDGVLKVKDGAVRMRLLPEASKYQYIVGGYNRGNDVLKDFFTETEFVISAYAENDGYKWGLANTALGQFWVAELSGKTELVLANTPTPAPTPAPVEPVGGNSPLVNYTLISPNKTSPRQDEIRKITIHHMAGNLRVEECGKVFQTKEASSNYGIETAGNIGMYVEEKDRSWCSSNSENDHQAITIEVANDGGEETNWHVNDLALARCIELCVDICKRNGMPGLVWTGDKNGTLTIHKMFAATACPGPYLESKMPWIAEIVTKWVDADTSAVTLKIGYASGGDVKSILALLNLKNLDYTEDGGYITVTVDGIDRVAVETIAEIKGVPVETVVQPEPEDPRIAELEAENAALRGEVETLTATNETLQEINKDYAGRLGSIRELATV